MTALGLVVGLLAALVLLLLGLREVLAVSAYRTSLAAALVEDGDLRRMRSLDRWDRLFRTTRPGRWLDGQLVLAGVDQPPLVVALVAAAAAATVAWVVWTALAPALSVVAVALSWFVLRGYLRRLRDRRREEFIAQMPELARVLSNATSAGLSITTALALAADELADPASTELRRVETAVRFGASVEEALDTVTDRLPSREVAVLVSTLVVSARSGGSLVTALRDIADTLEDRKEVRREIRTTLAQSLATGYLVIVIGIGLLFMLNAVQPGTVQAMTTTPAGQVALLVGFSLFGAGFLLVRRMTRIEP